MMPGKSEEMNNSSAAVCLADLHCTSNELTDMSLPENSLLRNQSMPPTLADGGVKLANASGLASEQHDWQPLHFATLDRPKHELAWRFLRQRMLRTNPVEKVLS
jgi:hypothetical protein